MSGRPTNGQVAWHHIEMEDARERLDTNFRDGLSSPEVLRRQEKYGLNRLTRQKRRSELVRFLLAERPAE